MLAFVFPGQGSQQLGMGKDFCENFRVSALAFEEASDVCRLPLRKLCFDGPLEELTETKNLQPALFTTQAAMVAALHSEIDCKPAYAAGHSLGEYGALFAAKAATLAQLTALVTARGAAMQAACPPGIGTMAAVLGLEDAVVEDLCAEARNNAPTQENVVSPANFNAPGQVVIAGHARALNTAIEIAKANPRFSKAKMIPLNVSAPFHCALMEPAQELLRPLLQNTSFQAPVYPVIANATAAENNDAQDIAELLAQQIVKPVLWTNSMKRLAELGVKTIVEIGPGKVLAGLQKRIDRNMEVVNIGTVADLKTFIEKYK